MVRLSSAVLMRAHEFLLEIHRASGCAQLRQLVPRGLASLIGCDRASFNELDVGDKRRVAPSPVPTWWLRLGEVYVHHLLDHPLWCDRVRLNQAVSFNDPVHASTWRRSVLYNEYFVALDMRQQLSSMVFAQGSSRIGIAVNRSSRDFSDEDRAVLELLSPHVACAWRNALKLERWREMVRPADGASNALDAGALVTLTPREREILRWLSEGKRNAEIALILGISTRTVGKHLEHLFEKLGVETRTAAACVAREAQYLVFTGRR